MHGAAILSTFSNSIVNPREVVGGPDWVLGPLDDQTRDRLTEGTSAYVTYHLIAYVPVLHIIVSCTAQTS